MTDERGDQRGDDPSKTFEGVRPSIRRHTLRDGREIGRDREGHEDDERTQRPMNGDLTFDPGNEEGP